MAVTPWLGLETETLLSCDKSARETKLAASHKMILVNIFVLEMFRNRCYVICDRKYKFRSANVLLISLPNGSSCYLKNVPY